KSLAHEVNPDRTCMGDIERGERNIAAINIIRIDKALKVDVGELFPAIRGLPLEQFPFGFSLIMRCINIH
ncbi:MAG: hypothetical protein NTU49_03620, partial [Gammaproteobacteria bacterium]|nr:hypothetical protein [Gammaproteobacteria bacterium]